MQPSILFNKWFLSKPSSKFSGLEQPCSLWSLCDAIVNRVISWKLSLLCLSLPYFFVHPSNLQLGLFNLLTQSRVLPVNCALLIWSLMEDTVCDIIALKFCFFYHLKKKDQYKSWCSYVCTINLKYIKVFYWDVRCSDYSFESLFPCRWFKKEEIERKKKMLIWHWISELERLKYI